MYNAIICAIVVVMLASMRADATCTCGRPKRGRSRSPGTGGRWLSQVKRCDQGVDKGSR
jgi:hypothetical protein